MKKFLTATLLGLTLAVTPACGLKTNVRSDVNLKEASPQQRIAVAIQNADAFMYSAEMALQQSYYDGAITYEEGSKYHFKIVEGSKYVDQARKLLEIGNLSQADEQMKLASALLLEVQRYLVSVKNGKGT